MPKQDQSQTPPPTDEQAAKLRELGHRVQSGIAALADMHAASQQRFPQLEPKHLRVGVNSALVECSAMARILFRKRIITAAEYYDALIEVWEQEVDSYRVMLKQIDPRLDI